jgi:hypothetical protein
VEKLFFRPLLGKNSLQKIKKPNEFKLLEKIPYVNTRQDKGI